MYDDTMMVDKAYYNELKDKPKDVQDRDIVSTEKLYDELLMLIDMHYEPPKE